ncbi:MAG TPA: DMT family transporter [Bacteroidales bacterium]|nr:DMT family transporter [Bacteroidales bacterium]HPF03986.1 DMT family transporter [Bacteroidales bacterium]HPJ58524.1 DMT family transporter [Bacteroidales bacterium]HPR11699.1 DMT family transporter [Bacteroidales bacterium]HRW85534.1 DMT family transporter [Bacteroidales bacterium]
MLKRDDTILWAVIACLLWSTVYAVIKLGLQYDTPLHFAGLRFMISGLMILPFALRRSDYLAMIREHWKIVVWVTLLQTLLNYIFFYLGMDLVPGAIGAIIVGSQPLVVAVVAALMHEGERLTGRKIITIILGITGVIMISAGRQALRIGAATEIIGVALILGANIATALSNVMVSLKSRGISPLVLSSSTLFTGGLLIYLISIPVEGTSRGPLNVSYWLSLAWLSFVSAYAFSLWFRLLQRPGVKVSELNLWKFIIPVVGAVLSWIIVPDEKPDWLTITGILIITGSLVGFYTNGKRFKSKMT